MNQQKYRHLYGPVPSRRLGSSLGVDLVPYKVCSYDCVYCQLGRTTEKTIHRKEYVPVGEVLTEIESKLKTGNDPAYISLAGSGEPTLNSEIGPLVRGIKKITDIPVAVLTNGSLLWIEEVRQGLMGADLIMPSLDAGGSEAFRKVNRPHPDIEFERMVEGLISFGREFPGEIWLEILLVGGVTDSLAEVGRIAGLAEKIAPRKIQLNTVYRPPAEGSARAVSDDVMREIQALFSGDVEIISPAVGGDSPGRTGDENVEKDILNMISRRPCTVLDMASGLGIHLNEIIKYLKKLSAEAQIVPEEKDGRTYYRPSTRRVSEARPGKDID